MGNTQSSPETTKVLPTTPTRTPTRLTKPRTLTNSHHDIPKQDQVAAPSWYDDCEPHLPACDTQAVSVELSDTQFAAPSGSHRPLSFYSSLGDQPHEQLTLAPDTEFDMKAAANLVHSIAKKTSMSTFDQSSHRQSTYQNEPAEMDVSAAIALLQELKKKATPDDLIALHKALLPARASYQDTNSSSDASGAPTSPLIRRSSFMPAGLATRAGADQARRVSQHLKQPDSASLQRASQNLAGLNIPGLNGQNGLSRSLTPADLLYLGNYELGSLRVTNGAASPEPSIVSSLQEKPSCSDLRSVDGYFTADEGTDDNRRVSEGGLSIRDRILSAASNRRDEAARGRAVSVGTQSAPKAKVPTFGADTYCESTDDDTDTAPSRRGKSRSRHRASIMADKYVEDGELPCSPYNQEHRLSTVQDEDEASSVGGVDEALRRLNGTPDMVAGRPSTGSDGSNHLQVQGRPVPAESDSGYGSERSTRSRDRHADKENIRPAVASDIKAGNQDLKSRQSMPHIATLQRSDRHNSMPVPKLTSPRTASGHIPTLATTKLVAVEKSLADKSTRGQQRHARNDSVLESTTMPGTPPAVLDEISVNFSRRLIRNDTGSFPIQGTQESLTTPVILRQTNLRMNLDMPSPSPTEKKNGRGRSGSRGTKVESDTPELPKKRSIFRLRGRSKSKGPEQRVYETRRMMDDEDGEDMPPVYDRGTVTQSIGSSPYDIAAPVIKLADLNNGTSTFRWPHQMESTPVKQSSRTGMDDQTASAQGRMRSREHVEDSSRAASRSRSRPRPTHDRDAQSSPATPKQSRRSTSAHPTRSSRTPAAAELFIPETPSNSEKRPKRRSHSVSPRAANSDMKRSASPVPEMPKLSAEDLAAIVFESPSQECAHLGWPGWEKQAALYRERRPTLPESLPNIEQTLADIPNTVASGSITPANTRKAREASVPRASCIEEANRAIEGSHNKNTTDGCPAQDDGPRIDSAISSKSYKSGASSSASSARSRNMHTRAQSEKDVAADSPSYRAYRQSAAVAMAKLTTPTRSHARGRSLDVSQYSIRDTTPSPESMFDRFSGGLDYGFERGVGFCGSAGTVEASTKKVSRKSVKLSESFGLDLSDVPVFMARR